MKVATPLARAALALGAIAALGTLPARATEPTESTPNTCVDPEVHQDCLTAADCAGNDRSTVCVEHTLGDPTSRQCENPCTTGTGVGIAPHPGDCAIGETCVEGRATGNQKTYYCKPSSFRVDLNLLDQCVAYHLGGLQPVASDNACSLDANLTKLLDQNGDSQFDIFDLDLCILAFLEQPSCDPATASCEDPDLVFCDSDDACGDGLYCDLERHACQRDCGLVASRESTLGELERKCTGNAKVCDETRGRCVTIDVSQSTCDVDSDCASGANCFLGRCAPKCYRSADCPSGGWYCTENNRCRALAPPDSEDGFTFDPQNYAIRFARDQMKLDAVQNTERSSMVILDLITKKVVSGNPSVSFGYRLELSYSLKQDSQCLKPFVDCSHPLDRPPGESEAACRTRQDDCYVDDTEQWVTLASPFGTIAAQGNTDIGIQLDTAAADHLSPGVYTATLRAIFDNGDSDSIPITFTKASPSGEYNGSLSIYKGTAENALNGSKPLTFGMRMKVYGDQPKRWDTLLQEYHLSPPGNPADENTFVDITSGFLVHGQLHGKSAFAFAKGGAKTEAANEIPFIGLYSPQLGRLRMIGLIDIAPDFCISENGACTAGSTTELQVKNVFGRPIRRQIEFIGPFDEATGRFHGIYREKISGLAADYDVTMEGGFILDQIIADDSPLALNQNSILPVASTVAFPNNAAVLTQINTDIATYCGTGLATDKNTGAYAKTQFTTQAAFASYIANARRTGPATADSALGRTTIFPQLREFKSTISDALAAMGTTTPQGQQDHLSIYDFLSSFVLPCTDASASPPPVCINQNAVRCGLALHQKAVISGWVNLTSVAGAVSNPTTGELESFCPDTIPLNGCPAQGSSFPALFALQEHNRFWSDLSQILKFDADKARSDAFLVLYRNAINPFAAGAALSYKMDKLRKSTTQYDQLVRLIVGPQAAKVLFTWPGRAFKSEGNDWLKTIQTIVSDRMDGIAELVDLERRIAANTGATDFIFADHMMQNEYLVQVYLMELQAHWQKELFSYRGGAGSVFERGQNILNQLNPAKNAIGVTPNRVYFENSHTAFYNWQNYREHLVSVLIPETKDMVAGAVDNLKNSMADLDAFEGSLYDGRKDLNATLNDMCGDPTPGSAGTTGAYCNELLSQFQSDNDFKKARDCALKNFIAKNDLSLKGLLGETYPVPTECPDNTAFDAELDCYKNGNELNGSNDCKQVVLTFMQKTNVILGTNAGATGTVVAPPTCTLTSKQPTINVNGAQRACVGGEMGALLQDKANLDLQRKLVISKLSSLLRRIETVFKLVSEIKSEDSTLRGKIIGFSTAIAVIDIIKSSLEKYTEGVGIASTAADCVIIVGLAAGTDCPGGAVAAVMTSTQLFVLALIEQALQTVSNALAIAKDVAQYDHDVKVPMLERGAELEGMEREVDPLIDEFQVLSQSSFDLSTQIADLRGRATEVIKMYNQDVTFVAEHLVGRETGSYLLGQAQVQEASNKFRDIVQYLYRTTVAFIHHFNVTPGDAASLIAQAQSVVTMDDVDGFVATLDKRALEYCGLHGLDCDYETNTETLRVSLRDTLFPNLRDVVDARSGKVLTAGQQFHNIITRPPFLKRRIRGNMPTDEIEIPFAVLATTLANTKSGHPEWQIDPLSCNQLIDGRDPSDPTSLEAPDASASMSGTMAVNFLGQNLDNPSKAIRYQIVRGATDFIRACQPENVVEEFGQLPILQYPIRKHVVGYAPQSIEAQKESPASFATVSQPFTACVNTGEAQGTLDAAYCWRYFARDRSLASPDWKLIIPLEINGAKTDSAWIAETDLAAPPPSDDPDAPQVGNPVVDDIVIYFRYRSRPIEEN